MARYSALLRRTASTSASVGAITASGTVTPRRAAILDMIIGSEATPADNPFLWRLQRCTGAGSFTTVTPVALDPEDPASIVEAGENHTVEPTYTASAYPLAIPVNQRQTFRWAASPGSELLIPAVAGSGIGFTTPTAGAVAVTCQLYVADI